MKMATSKVPSTPKKSQQSPAKQAKPAPHTSTPQPAAATVTPAAATPNPPPSNRPNGGFCHAGCTNPAAPIQEDRSSLYYLLDLSGKHPEVIDIFQYHSHEYPPQYSTTLNSLKNQCDTKFHQTFQPGSNVHALVSGKPYEIGFLTGETQHLLDIIEKCYALSPQAVMTIHNIRRLTSQHASYIPPVNPIEPAITTPDVYYYLYRFVEDYKYNVRKKIPTDIVVESQSDTQYKIRFINTKLGYIIPAQLIESPKFKIITGKKFTDIINKSKVIP